MKLSREQAQQHRQWRATRKAVAAQFTAGAATVPAVAGATGISPAEVLWHVAGMRKYGLLEEVGMDGDYPTYRLVATKADEGSD